MVYHADVSGALIGLSELIVHSSSAEDLKKPKSEPSALQDSNDSQQANYEINPSNCLLGIRFI